MICVKTFDLSSFCVSIEIDSVFFVFSRIPGKRKKNIHRLLDREGGLTRKALNNHTMIEKVLRV